MYFTVQIVDTGPIFGNLCLRIWNSSSVAGKALAVSYVNDEVLNKFF